MPQAPRGGRAGGFQRLGTHDSPRQTNQLVEFAVGCRVEGIFLEPVNLRGSGLKCCREAPRLRGSGAQAGVWVLAEQEVRSPWQGKVLLHHDYPISMSFGAWVLGFGFGDGGD